MSFKVTNIADQTCTQSETFDVTRPLHVSVITAQIAGNVLRINDGEFEAILANCFTGPRLSIAVGAPVREPNRSGEHPEIKTAVFGYAVAGSDGATRVNVSMDEAWIGPYYTTRGGWSTSFPR